MWLTGKILSLHHTFLWDWAGDSWHNEDSSIKEILAAKMSDSWQGLPVKDPIGQTKNPKKPKKREHDVKETVDKRRILVFWGD